MRGIVQPYHVRANLAANAPTHGDGVRVAYASRGAHRLTELVYEAFDQAILDISHKINIRLLHKFVAGVFLGGIVKRIAPKMFVVFWSVHAEKHIWVDHDILTALPNSLPVSFHQLIPALLGFFPFPLHLISALLCPFPIPFQLVSQVRAARYLIS